ncbi:MAG TPA: acetyl-CoA carboxylase biotin carboxyl carrier protein [Pirellulales bacterium]|jgi:acetyl-CoA carboxylase biotin carboxyl carrier protein|nr:acetyl-CoA carboxylase biotin carboxyl carrier protein [Pirellulales bacterium]
MSSSGAGGGDIFDVKKVRRLVELMKEHDLAEIDLRQGDQRIRLRRGGEPQLVGGTVYVPTATGSSPPRAATSSAPAATDSALEVIKSPMVGTFYAAGNPESPPFVKVGDHVGPESVVCVIEAMKVFNEIQAEIAGQVAAVLVENGQPVEFGQPLFKIDTRK